MHHTGLLRLLEAFCFLIIPFTSAGQHKQLDSAIAIASTQLKDTLINCDTPADCDFLVLNYKGTRYAFIAINHDHLYLCRWRKNGFIPVDSTVTDRDLIRNYRIVDINGDGLPDVILSSYWNMHGMAKDYIFLGARGGSLSYLQTSYNLFNSTYNLKTHKVTTFYEGGVNSTHSKTHYKWIGRKLIWLEEWDYDMFDGTMCHYINKAGQRILLQKKQRAEKGWNRIVDTFVWP